MIKILPIFFMICASALAQTDFNRLETALQRDAADTNLVNHLIEEAQKLQDTDRETFLEYARQAESLSERLDYNKGRSESLRLIGMYYLMESNYPLSFEYYKQALDIAEKMNIKNQISNGYNSIGIIYYHQKDYDKAIEYYQKGLTFALEIQDSTGIPRGYNNIGEIYSLYGEYPKALEYFHKALKITEQTGESHRIAWSYYNIGKTHRLQKNYTEAYAYHLNALNIGLKNNLKDIEAISYYGLGDLFFHQHNIEEAYHYSRKAYILSLEIEEIEIIQLSSGLLAEAASALGRYKDAYEYHQIFKTMSDSLKNEENTRKILSLEYEYKFANEKEIAEQEKKDAVLMERMKKQAIIRNIIFVSLIIIFIACMVLLYQHKLLKASLKEKVVLLKEIHHRVKNNLQIISSLFSLQSSRVKDEKTKQLLQNSRNRIHSIAKIHERLYQSDNFSKVDFNYYIKDLSENLLNIYNRSENINLIFSGEQTDLTIEKAVPCGLILNELLTNALKHAFKKGQKGKIKISISKNKDGRLVLTAEDNGRGMPDNFDFEKTETLGLKMVKVLTEQLEGEIHFRLDNGVLAALTFEQ